MPKDKNDETEPKVKAQRAPRAPTPPPVEEINKAGFFKSRWWGLGIDTAVDKVVNGDAVDKIAGGAQLAVAGGVGYVAGKKVIGVVTEKFGSGGGVALASLLPNGLLPL